MSSKMPQIGLRALRLFLRCMMLFLLLLGVAGCGAVGVGTPSAQLRIVHASPDAGIVDIYSNGSTGLTGTSSGNIAYNLSFGTVTSYTPVAAATSTVSAKAAGSSATLASIRLNLAGTKQYTLLIDDASGAGLQTRVLADQSKPAAPGQVALRFLDELTTGDSVDLYLLPASGNGSRIGPIATGMWFGANSGYLSIPTGTYTLYVMAAGEPLRSFTRPLYVGEAIAYPNGSARTVVLLHQASGSAPAVKAITLDDFDAASSLP